MWRWRTRCSVEAQVELQARVPAAEVLIAGLQHAEPLVAGIVGECWRKYKRRFQVDI